MFILLASMSPAWVAAEASYRRVGISTRHLIHALLVHGIASPDQLLQLGRRELKLIPGVGKKGLAEIEAYRVRVTVI